MQRPWLMLVCILTVILTTVKPSSGKDYHEDANEAKVFLFTYFIGNGEDGLHLAWSEDGANWQPLGNGRSFLRPQVGSRLMRDPCLILGPDGVFHMVRTTGWQDRGVGLAHSKDLLEWSEQQYVPLMEDMAGARNCWAPEIIWDPDSKKYVIFWSSTVEGRFPETAGSGDNGWNHRIYRTLTGDFKGFTRAELFYEPGFNVIDATITRGPKGYVMVVKDETRHPPAKNLRVAFSSTILGPWSAASEPFSPKDVWAEGPTVLRVGSWWYIYFDKYTQQRYGAMRTRDFRQFEDVSDQCRFPAGIRHGTALAVPTEVFNALRKAADH